MRRALPLQLLLVLGVASGGGNTTAASGRRVTPRQRMVKALNLSFPEIKFEGARLTEVVSFLSSESGVNIIIDPAVYVSASQSPTTGTAVVPRKESPPETAPPAAVEGAMSDTQDGKTPSGEGSRITLHLKNVPLKVVLKYVLRYKNLRYIVEDYAIVIVPAGRALPEELVTEVFRLRTGSFNGVSQVQPGADRPF